MNAKLPVRKKLKTLLIADDEPNIRLLVRRTFQKEYVVIEATNGKEAIDLALRDKPDIIVLDVMMPQTDGLTALSTIRGNKRTSAIPVIMLTGVGFELNEQLAGSLGAKAYLKKPIIPQDLFDAVTKVIKGIQG